MKINNRGYSLIELVVSIAILAGIALVSANMFLRTTLGSSKDNTNRLIKQNGDYAINFIETSFRGSLGLAPGFNCGPDMAQVSLINPQEQIDMWQFYDQADTPVLLYNSDPLVDTDNLVVSDVLVNCNLYPANNVAYLTVQFTLSMGSQDSDRATEVGSETFRTAVAIRNR